MADAMTIEAQGEHEYVVRLDGGDEVTESWVRVTPEVLEQLGVPAAEEEQLVRRTVDFLLRHQGAPKFPRMVELEDVLASYDDYAAAVTAG
jgi:hypothetical protein